MIVSVSELLRVWYLTPTHICPLLWVLLFSSSSFLPPVRTLWASWNYPSFLFLNIICCYYFLLLSWILSVTWNLSQALLDVYVNVMIFVLIYLSVLINLTVLKIYSFHVQPFTCSVSSLPVYFLTHSCMYTNTCNSSPYAVRSDCSKVTLESVQWHSSSDKYLSITWFEMKFRTSSTTYSFQ
jgi:hypothetical protein